MREGSSACAASAAATACNVAAVIIQGRSSARAGLTCTSAVTIATVISVSSGSTASGRASSRAKHQVARASIASQTEAGLSASPTRAKTRA